jgi:hypothetical protein
MYYLNSQFFTLDSVFYSIVPNLLYPSARKVVFS